MIAVSKEGKFMCDDFQFKSKHEILKTKSFWWTDDFNVHHVRKVYVLYLRDKRKKDGFRIIEVSSGSVEDYLRSYGYKDKILGVYIENVEVRGDGMDIEDNIFINEDYRDWFEKKYESPHEFLDVFINRFNEYAEGLS